MSERLWAPWRMQFVSKEHSDDRCLFCRVAEEPDDRANLVLLRTGHSLVMLNAFPYTNGHLMAVPLRHTADFTSLSPTEMQDVMELAQRGIRALTEVYGAQGFNVGLNLGSAAGAGIADHIHVHVVPRWVGDTNFMAAVGDTRVLPDSLDSSYEKLLKAIRHE